MAWLRIYSHRLNEPSNEFFKSFIPYFILFCAIVCDMTSSAMFILKHLSEFLVILDPCFIVISGFQSGGMYLCAGVKLNQIKRLHLKLQEIVDEGQHFVYAKNVVTII